MKKKVLGLVLVATMLIGGMSTVALAADKPADEGKELGDTCTEESFIDYAKSLGVLSESELAELEKTEQKAAEIDKQIEKIYQKGELSKDDEAKLEELYNHMNELYAGIDDIMLKIYGDKDAEEQCSLVDYAKELGVLNENELAKLAETEKKTDTIQAKIDKLCSKKDITKEDEEKINALYQEVDKLNASIEDITNKIYGTDGFTEQFSMVDYAKELGVLNESELAKLAETEKKADAIQAQIDEIYKKTKLTEEDETKLNTLYDERGKLYKGVDDIMNKIYGPDENIEDYSMVDYAKELGVLNKDELAKIADTEKKTEAILVKIDKVYEKTDLTEADEAKVKELMNEIEKLNAGLEDIMKKIYDAEQQKYIDELKSLGVLSNDEMVKFTEAQKKEQQINAQIDELWKGKDELSKEAEAKFEKLTNELNKLFEETQPLYDKIFSVEDVSGIVYDEDAAA